MRVRTWAAADRTRLFREMAEQPLDVLVIGGGITGAGILLDATVRGLRAGLVEMQDFAAGTSNRSTKLVHGGLRYLKQGEVRLVAEVGRERAIVHRLGPHITTPVWMLLPIIEGGTYGWFATSIGVWLYDRLAGVRREERRKMLPRDAALAREPLLRRDGLRGAGCYVEYRTDDARLTLEVLLAALERGAKAVNYARAERLLYEDGRVVGGRVVGARVRDVQIGETYEVRARFVVNAAGPWVDEVREMDGSKTGKTLHHTKGVHIVVDGARFPLKNAVYFDVPDGRMVFAIPRDGKTYIGTTDTDYHGDLAHPRMTIADRDYLLDCVRFMFPSIQLTPADIESAWAGVRPLIHEEGRGPSEISRRDEVFVSPTGLISIAGGKLTGYRKMAEKVVDLVARRMAEETGRALPPCSTDRVPYAGGHVGGAEGWPAYRKAQVAEGRALGLETAVAARIVQRYGSNAPEVWALLPEARERADAYGLPADVLAELLYGLRHEMVVRPADFVVRRTGMLYFDMPALRRVQGGLLAAMADELGWDAAEREEAAQELAQAVEEATVPLPAEPWQASTRAANVPDVQPSHAQ
ncbi:MAG: glycerol-3-phosphate dehydrogenase/oxidase [Thermoflavifilum sp.]|nr:glycerol-3-phosphate dehydrogenase/oxidase [Thermoflavifilum sp.]MCL6514521.1 glycerol-3-phosphate dehydrogenase/oxidase [Alicyclobacillus sp.]